METNAVRPKPDDPSVYPIIMPKVNWPAFLTAVQEMGISSPTHILDENGVSTEELPALTLVLSRIFGQRGSSMVDAIRNAGNYLLQHTQTSFLVHADTDVLTEVTMQIDLKISAKGNIAVFSESLDKWRAACIEGTNINKTKACRTLFNKVITWLEQGALVHLFWGFKKIRNVDETFSLKLG